MSHFSLKSILYAATLKSMQSIVHPDLAPRTAFDASVDAQTYDVKSLTLETVANI